MIEVSVSDTRHVFNVKCLWCYMDEDSTLNNYWFGFCPESGWIVQATQQPLVTTAAKLQPQVSCDDWVKCWLRYMCKKMLAVMAENILTATHKHIILFANCDLTWMHWSEANFDYDLWRIKLQKVRYKRINGEWKH